MSRRFWSAPPTLWRDETVFVVGGGPSLRTVPMVGLASRRTIAVNDAYQVTPNVSAVLYADSRWWRWHKEKFYAPPASMLITTASTAANLLDPRALRMNRDYRYADGGPALSDNPEALSGPDGGYMAINLAYLLGASRIVLLGIDMGFAPGGRAHWHPEHPVPSIEANYQNLFAPHYPALVAALAERGVEVLRCTPSRLDFIPEIGLEQALRLPNKKRQQD